MSVIIVEVETFIDNDDAARLRDALKAARYDTASLTERFGDQTMAAARRGDLRALLAATTDLDPQATLVRLFRGEVAVPRPAAIEALAPLRLETAQAAGLLTVDGEEIRAGLALSTLDDGWLLSDPPRSALRQLPGDHVLGPGDAAATMSRYMRKDSVGSALDVGCGSGVLGLTMARHASQVTGTDLSARALRFAAANSVLNEMDWELLRGDMLEPVSQRGFDLVVSNPPFIVGPGRTDFDYRDSGRPADEVCAELARRGCRMLNPRGSLQFLANWVHVRGWDWRQRVAEWFDGSQCDVWAIQRDVLDPLDYVRLWERDSAAHDPDRLAHWLDWFDANDIEAVGFGMVTAYHSGTDEPSVVCEELRHGHHTPDGARVAAWCDTVTRLRDLDDSALLDSRLRLSSGSTLRQEAALGAEGWEVERQVLVAGHGELRQEEIDPVLVSLLGSCTGEASLRTQIGLLSAAHDGSEGLLTAALLPLVRRFIQQGFVELV